MPTGDLLTTRQLQELLQVDRVTIYRMLSDGRLTGFKVGGQWRFSRHEIEKWLQEQRATPDVGESPGETGELRPAARVLPLGDQHARTAPRCRHVRARLRCKVAAEPRTAAAFPPSNRPGTDRSASLIP